MNKPLLDQKITEAQCGSQAAYNYLLNSHWNLVYNFQLARTQDEFKAEEITIQTFSKAFNQLHTYNSSYQFGTWLITISKNLQIDLFRKEQSRQRHLEKDNQLNKVIDENPTAEDALITEQNLSVLKNGKAKAIRLSTLDAICKALDCQPGDLLAYEAKAD